MSALRKITTVSMFALVPAAIVGLGTGTAGAATGSSAGFAEPGMVSSGVAELTGEVRDQAIQGDLREADEVGLMVQGEIRQSVMVGPSHCAEPFDPNTASTYKDFVLNVPSAC